MKRLIALSLSYLMVAAALPALSMAAAPATTQPQPLYSAATLYNMGNAFARAGKPGLAVLNYERASLLAPEDPDILANLRLVRQSAHVPTGEPRDVVLSDAPTLRESLTARMRGAPRAVQTLLLRMVTALRPTEMFWLGIAGLALFGAGVAAAPHSLRLRRLRRGLAGIGLSFMALTLGQAVLLWPTLHAGVVMTAETPVRVSPAPMGDLLFTLPEAQTVTLGRQHEDFVLVSTADGKSGWVARANVEPVVPPRRSELW